MAQATAATKRLVGDDTPCVGRIKQCLGDDLKERVTRHGIETLLALVDSRHADVTIQCQGRGIRACGLLLFARCKFFNACFNGGNFKEAQSKTVVMDDDDPDALEAFIIYLHPSSTIHIENWNILFGGDHYPNYFVRLPEGYFPFLVEVYRVADKYDTLLLAEAVPNLFAIDSSDLSSDSNRISEWDRSFIVEEYCDNYPTDLFEALVLLQTVPDSSIKAEILEIIHYTIRVKRLADPLDPTRAAKIEKYMHELFVAYPAIKRDLLAADVKIREPREPAGEEKMHSTVDEERNSDDQQGSS